MNSIGHPTVNSIAYHEPYIRQVIDLAIKSQNHGNHPFGALLVVGNKVVLVAENTVYTGKNDTQHAENNLANEIAKAIADKKLTKEQVKSGILYTSTEPCAMCSGAVYIEGVRTIVFGCLAEDLRKITHPGESAISLSETHVPACIEIFKSHKDVTVIGPILSQEVENIHAAYWPNRIKV